MVIFGGTFTQFFMNQIEADVIHYSSMYLNVAAGFFVVLGQLFIHRNALQGMGNSFVPMMAGASELLMRVIVAFTLSQIFGYIGVCFANPIAWIGAEIPLAITYFRTIKRMLRQQ